MNTMPMLADAIWIDESGLSTSDVRQLVQAHSGQCRDGNAHGDSRRGG